MVEYNISLCLNEKISFMTEKGVSFAVKKDSGGYDLYGNKYAADFVASWAKKILSGREYNFPPIVLCEKMPKQTVCRDIDFKLQWDLLKTSTYRKEYRTVGFFPALWPYTEVPKSLRPPSDVLNTFQKFAISEGGARAYCLQKGMLDQDDFEESYPMHTIYDYYIEKGVLNVDDDDNDANWHTLLQEWLKAGALSQDDVDDHKVLNTSKLRSYLLNVGAITTDEWRPHACLTENGRAKLNDLVKPMYDHVFSIVCRDNMDDCDYFFNYCAHMFQKPWEKPGVAIVMRSDGKGAGKGAVVDPLLKIMGGAEPHFHAAEVSDASSILEGNMNGLLSQKIAIMLDEAYWAGSAKDKGKLRNLITCAHSTIRLMYTNPFKEASFLRVFFMSNDEQLVPYDSVCERRYKCYDLDNKYKGIQSSVTKAHFDPIYAIPSEVYALWLYHRNIAAFNPRKFVVGVAERGQINASMGPVEQFWFNCLDQGYVALERERKCRDMGTELYSDLQTAPMKRVWAFGACYIPKCVIFTAYEAQHRGGRTMKNAQFFSALWKIVDPTLVTQVEKHTTGYGGFDGRPACALFKSLQECRSKWMEKYGPLWRDNDDDDDNRTYSPCAPSWVVDSA